VMLDRSGGQDVRRILKPVLRVPEKAAILSLLRQMQKAFCQMAVVKDEFGVTEGLVTQEDILEEIVGEIRDEFDLDELGTISKVSDRSYEVLGRVLVHDLNRQTGWALEAGSGDTLSGVVFNSLGRAARRGDQVSVGDYHIYVSDVSGSRISRVRVSQLEGASPSHSVSH